MRNPHPSTTHNVLTLAKQDEVSLIATLLNCSLHPRGITARVGWNNNCLGILLEAIPIPDPEEMLALIRQSLATLNSESIRLVKVCGYQPGQSLPAWYEEIELEGISASDPCPVPSLASWLNQGIPESGYEAASIGYSGLPAQSSVQHSESAIDTATSFSSSNSLNAVDARFLRFYFNAKETALLPLSSIQQVLKVPVAEILPVPHMPARVIGIYNWRGEMLWLVDLSQQLGFVSTLMDCCALESVTAIVIHSDGKSLGIVVPRLSDVETCSLSHLQPPTSAFPAKLLSFMKGYFLSSNSPVLDVKALIQDPLLQVHCPH